MLSLSEVRKLLNRETGKLTIMSHQLDKIPKRMIVFHYANFPCSTGVTYAAYPRLFDNTDHTFIEYLNWFIRAFDTVFEAKRDTLPYSLVLNPLDPRSLKTTVVLSKLFRLRLKTHQHLIFKVSRNMMSMSITFKGFTVLPLQKP